MRKSFALLALLMLLASAAVAAPRTKAQMEQAARQAINHQRSQRHMAPSAMPVKVLRSIEQVEIIGTEEGGFAVIAADDLMPAVLGVSTARYSQGKNPNFEWWLTATAEAAKHVVQSQAPLQVTKPDPTKYPEEVAPMVTTKWYQMEPYDGMCPIFSGNTHCLTGCVATSMAQILNYHQSPEHGYGQRTIYYHGQAVSANFEEDYYDWANMLDIYIPGNYTQEEADAVALLMRDCGVAANMEYGGPDEGSGAYSQDAAEGLRTYFGFDEAQCLERDYYSEPDWMDIIYRELSENGPLYYGGGDYMYGGHAFLFDGYNAEGQVSVNWGWAGDDDGFYHVSQLNPSYYHWNYAQDMIIGVKSGTHSLLRTEKVTVSAAGQLQQKLEETEAEGVIGTLTVEGPLNKDDMMYLRFLAGWNADGEATEGRLRLLDLTKATLEENTLPEGLFRDCTSLRLVRLPETISAIGAEAFKGCSGLGELRVTTKTVPTLLGMGVFDGLPFGVAKLYVRSSMKTKFVQAAQWNQFGENNIIQVGTTLKVRNAIRKYGERNPVFTYTVNGNNVLPVEGMPAFSTDARPNSPAGRYVVHISAGSMENAEAYDFTDGYLIVQKVAAKATVKDAERFVGDPNPEFKLQYEGLVNKDVEPVWLQEPVFATSATSFSKPGVYTVFVKSAEAESYEITFQPGKLIVKEKPVPSGINEMSADDGQKPAYNLQGQRVNQQRKGISIVGGKKVIR